MKYMWFNVEGGGGGRDVGVGVIVKSAEVMGIYSSQRRLNMLKGFSCINVFEESS